LLEKSVDLSVDNKLLDGFYLDRLLVKPTTGQVVSPNGSKHLPSKAMEVLLRLARRPRRLVMRDDLLEQVWGDRHRSPDVLSHAVSEIRRALGDHAESPRFIQTVPTRGYRLLIEPTAEASEDHGGLEATAASDHEATAEAARSIWQALIRHGVVQAGAAYLVAGWLLIQIADTTFEDLGLPSWSEAFITFAVIGGFPIAILLAWFLEFAEGRMTVDEGRQSAGMFAGLERNYVALFIAFGVAGAGAAVYQAVVGFEVAPAPDRTAAAELVPVADNSLAVLRLMSIGGGDRARLFADGLSEDLIDAHARLPGLLVSSRGDSWSLPENATSEIVRRRLRVAHFIEGSVRPIDDNTLRVVVQLIDSNTGFHVVSRTFKVATENLANVETEITRLIVANLRLALDSDTIDPGALPPAQTVVDAYLSYRRGLQELYKPRSETTIAAALGHFSEALEIDPAYPAAHAGRCQAYTTLYRVSRDPTDIATAEEACSQAYAAGSQLPLVLNAVGRLYLTTGKNEQARNMFERAIEIDDRHAASIRGLATVAERELDFDEAEALFRRAIELQPGNWNSMSSLAGLYFNNGRYADAAREYRKIRSIDPGNFAVIGNLGAASLLAGDLDTARDALEESLGIEFDPYIASNLGIVYYYLGNFEKSVEIHRRVVDASPKSSGSLVNLGDALHFYGDSEGARSAFTTAIDLARTDLGVNPVDPEALTYLAWSLAMTGAIDDGLQTVGRALEIDPADPYSHYYAGLIHLRNGDPGAAIDAFAEALKYGYEASLLAMEPYVASLDANPRFSKLLAEFGSTGGE
jgi:tetratricopeptide (TPR) repeat protein/DNA-binding winged helix-turn-helix (wHTH) protein/TolB-like protein